MAAPVSQELVRARVGVSVIFLVNGLLLGSVAPRIPELRDNLALSYSGLGVTMAMWPIGAMVCGLAAARLMRRFESRRVAVWGMVGCAIALLAAGVSPTAVLLGTALFVFGAFDSWVDIAMNAHGLRVQRRYRRSILNSFHALWSIGAVVGGLLGGVAAGLGLPVAWHFASAALVTTILALTALPLHLATPDVDDATPQSAEHHTGRGLRRVSGRTWLLLGALSLIAIAAAFAEDAGATWSASYLRDGLGAGATVAALGFVALQGTQFVGRLLGDRMVDRFGQRLVARVGGTLTAVGMGAALLAPSVPLTIVGFAAAGFGIATLIPGAMHAADELPGFDRGTGLTILSWLLRVGFLASPPLIGFIADASSLRVALALVPVSGLVVVALAGALQGRRAPAEETPTATSPSHAN